MIVGPALEPLAKSHMFHLLVFLPDTLVDFPDTRVVYLCFARNELLSEVLCVVDVFQVEVADRQLPVTLNFCLVVIDLKCHVNAPL